MLKRSFFPLAFTAMIAVSQAFAGVVVYTDRPSFEAALGYTGVVEAFTGNTITTSLTAVTDVGTVSGDEWADHMTGSTTTTFGFGYSVIAFGGDFDLTPAGEGSGVHFELNLTGGGTFDVSTETTYPGGFYGLISDAGFDSIHPKNGS